MVRHVYAPLLLVLGLNSSSLGQFGLPPGFSATELISTQLASPTCMCIAQDGTIYIAQQAGAMRVWRESSGLLPTQFFSNAPLNVEFSGERGLIGMALDPDYATNRYLYVHYSMPTTPRRARVSRFTADVAGNLALPGSEAILLEFESSASIHKGGALHFDSGMLFVAIGDNANGANSQSVNNLYGKILRIRPIPGDVIPTDNPDVFPGISGSPSGINRAIWAVGLRNPFTFAVHPVTGRMMVNDVGDGSFEEINEVVVGRNYGWPATEGSFEQSAFPDFSQPYFAYPREIAPTYGWTIAGGVFYSPTTSRFPADYYGDYFFGDYSMRWISRIDSSSSQVSAFAWSTGSIVDLDVDDVGRLLFLRRGSSAGLFRIDYSPPPPACVPFQVAELQPLDSLFIDFFGQSVDMDGDTLVIGAPLWAGAAFVFKRTGTTWTQQARLVDSDGTSGDKFGCAVAIDGNTILVGAELNGHSGVLGAGAAFVFVRNGDTWSQQAKLVAPDAAAYDLFGHSVALCDDTAVMGAINNNSNGIIRVGSAYVFLRSGTSWSMQSELIASDALTQDKLGSAVAISGDTIAAGAVDADVPGLNGLSAGAVYVFTRFNDTWQQQAKLRGQDTAGGDNFGNAIALSGDRLVVGAYNDDVAGVSNTGSVYVYSRSNGAWLPGAQITAPNALQNDRFGSAVAISGNMIVIGANESFQPPGGSQAGAAYIFGAPDSGWLPRAKIVPGNSEALDHFGSSVAISGNLVLIGAPHGYDSDPYELSSAFVFDFSEIKSAADLNDDGAFNGTDLRLFSDVLLGNDYDPTHVARSDVNCDGTSDASDISMFVSIVLGG